MTIVNDADERIREKKRRRRRRRRKKTILGRRRSTRFFYHRASEISLCPPFLYAIGSARNQKNLLKANGPFFICVKILIASATRFAAFGAEKEEREKETRASSYLLRRERERVFLSRHPSSLKEEI